ncbi:MAG: hypothetical protein ACE5IY_18625 [bacterium]
MPRPVACCASHETRDGTNISMACCCALSRASRTSHPVVNLIEVVQRAAKEIGNPSGTTANVQHSFPLESNTVPANLEFGHHPKISSNHKIYIFIASYLI